MLFSLDYLGELAPLKPLGIENPSHLHYILINKRNEKKYIVQSFIENNK